MQVELFEGGVTALFGSGLAGDSQGDERDENRREEGFLFNHGQTIAHEFVEAQPFLFLDEPFFLSVEIVLRTRVNHI